MVSRVVLGCGAVGQRLVGRLGERDGVDAVVCESESHVETLRSENVTATIGDPTDPTVLAELPAATTVMVATDDSARNLAVVRAARQRYGDAFVLAYAGDDGGDDSRDAGGSAAGDGVREALEAAADVVVDPTAVVVDSVTEQVVGDRAEDTRRLRQTLREVDGELAVVMHDNPDPDAIASAVALATLANALGTPARPCYYGDISHQENRAMVNLLDLDLENLDVDADVRERFGGFALVDHSRPGVNDQLPEDLEVDVVVDHHPPRGGVPARYADLRADVGATSTLVLDHLHRYGIVPSATVSTALMYGIQVDTHDFSREVSTLDFEAAASILPSVDGPLLEKVESPSVSADTMDTLASAIEDRTVRGSVLVSFAGEINDRDALPQAADRLLTMEGITTVLVYGVLENDVVMSARARGVDVDLGETLRIAFDHIGSAGGHADMAGAQVPITDAFGAFESDDERLAAVRDVVTEAFFEALHARPTTGGQVEGRETSAGFGFERVLDVND
ncbi:bifunctional oligoribonuclease/PAP phosphatase NrnA [Halorubellus sp. JP-L1]|uniref:DHH family phosphoesterase n=1 Tax=Halorubellus sp. JP-L1 TaxID=2715753 RepID=UPI001407A8BE|nr:DHH family phosphoesterase [Halorubellus sp. JP-L1]NHN40137.1 bifunctional oligoribonuclease/PAP phosphatase NrnA [Halorubellus sp. JP-L1]